MFVECSSLLETENFSRSFVGPALRSPYAILFVGCWRQKNIFFKSVQTAEFKVNKEL
jgi:hypothetical protein